DTRNRDRKSPAPDDSLSPWLGLGQALPEPRIAAADRVGSRIRRSIGLRGRNPVHGIAEAPGTHVGPVGLDPVQASLAFARRPDRRPARRDVTKSRPQGVLTLVVHQHPVLAILVL